MTHWTFHPAVRTGSDLTVGERAADKLKAAFGSWRFLLTMIGGIVVWIAWNKAVPASWRWDSTDLLFLNLTLSIVAGLQGGALQIASNRGDRINSELAKHTFENGQVDRKNGERLVAMNEQQLTILDQQTAILTRLDTVTQELHALRADVAAQDDNTGRTP